MIISNNVEIKTKNNSNLKYFKDIGYDIDHEFIIVKVEHLLPNCKEIIEVQCDYCGKKEHIKYIEYTRKMKSFIKKYACTNCKGKKTKESNLLKYGVTSVAKLEESKQKVINTNLLKYGVENHAQSEEVKNKIKITNIDKWGVDCVLKSNIIREKIKKTNLIKYGFDNPSKNEKIKELKKETCLLNWGVDIPIRNKSIRDRINNTNLKKYGEKYLSTSELFRKNNFKIAQNEFYISYKGDGISIFNCDCGKDHIFEISKDVYCKRTKYNIKLCTICNPVGDQKSQKEKDLHEFIESIYNFEIIKGYRDIFEIDIYLPDLKIGFEFNGLYWHSSLYREKNYHLNKTNFFKERGIRIIHIWEDDWDYKCDIIKSQITNILKLNTNKIYARNCEIKEVSDISLIKDFLNENHIQGYTSSKIKIGLFHQEKLVSLMTFDKFEGRKKMKKSDWNLNRFCNQKYTNIIGSASKLFKYFIKSYNPSRIVSYADKCWSDGGLYYKLNFNLINEINPDYKYIVDGKRIHKSRFRKSRTGINESDINLLKILDCGKMKFEFYI